MNWSAKPASLLLILVAGLGWPLPGRLTAQTLTTLYNRGTNDGGAPLGEGLVLSGDTLYGTASQGGFFDNGTVFAVKTNGTGFTILHDFTFLTPASTYQWVNPDGAAPEAGLVLAGDTLYGTAVVGGGGAGTVFKLKTDGTGFTTIYSCYQSGWFGAYPMAGLFLSGDTLFGTFNGGCASQSGSVFSFNTNGASGPVQVLHFFSAVSPPNVGPNLDGAFPRCRPVVSSNVVYGTTEAGGNWANGTVWAVTVAGTEFTVLHHFTASDPTFGTNADGIYPRSGLILAESTLYGTTTSAGSGGSGTVFALSTDGMNFRTLHSFGAASNSTNSDGVGPFASLVLIGHTLYGTTGPGGVSGGGTVFAVNTDGSDFKTLHAFSAASSTYHGTNTDGAQPGTALTPAGETLYGTTSTGGTWGYGTLFSLSLVTPPVLNASRSAGNIVLRWTTNAAGFNLESTTHLVSSAVWTTNLVAPVVVEDQYTVTNPVTPGPQFFRLSR